VDKEDRLELMSLMLVEADCRSVARCFMLD
jgi:hypothetical protein